MSNYAMMGLLEGLGRGITGTGQAMEKLNLQQAEERRQMNLARIQREWSNQDENARYTRNLADQERITKDTREYNEGQETIKRAQTVADQDKALKAEEEKEKRQHTNRLAEIDHQGVVTAKNRQPSDYERRKEEIDKLHAEGKISDEERKNYILGIQKTATFSAKDLSDLRIKTDEEARIRIVGKDPMKPITAEERAAIKAESDELFKRATGGQAGGNDGGDGRQGYHPGSYRTIADSVVKAGYDPAKDRTAQHDKMVKSGVSVEDANRVLDEADKIVSDRNKSKKEDPDRRPDPKPKYNPETKRMEPTNPAYIEWQNKKGLLEKEKEEAEQKKIEARRQSAYKAPFAGNGSSSILGM